MNNDEWKKQYDVFISYAHADAETDAQKQIVRSIKTAIDDALQEVFGRESCAFLDSEALGWGDEWSAKIRRCIDNADFFVYLLSPNYLLSSYCQREKLWWARHEIRQGRLNKYTRPIYFVPLPEAGGDADNVREQMICQTDGLPLLDGEKPFFDSLDEVRQEEIKRRLDKLKSEIKEKLAKRTTSRKNLCTIRRFNEFFVGRLMDLANLNEMCQEQGTIPVISGYPGIGKSELAITYAHAYEEDFPQGRFFIPMQGVTTWNAALSRLVEQFRVRQIDPADIGFPEDLDKMPEEDCGREIWNWLRRRAQKGQLLLLLDNLEKPELLDAVPDRWSYATSEELPIRIMATTRLKDIPRSENCRWEPLEIRKMDHKDALELFCTIGGNIFPFAKWPFSIDGKLLLDELPEKKRPSPETVAAIEKEFEAVNKIIDLLDGHPWSLEIAAGYMAKNPAYSFADKQRELENDPEISGRVFKDGIEETRTPAILLQPTLETLRKFDGIAEELGQNMLRLAGAASFFPPEQVPQEALKGIWCQQFGDEILVLDNGEGKARSCARPCKRFRNTASSRTKVTFPVKAKAASSKCTD